MATVELYEKVGEITIAELRPASMNHAIAKAEQERQAEIKRIEAEEAERKRQARASKVLAKVVEAINNKSDNGVEHLEIMWRTDRDDVYGVSASDWKAVGDIITEILTNYGYSVHDPHWYTSSWTTRSGKIGYVDIYWHKS